MAEAPTSSRHIPALDGVRGLAVLIVFVYHYGGGAQSSNLVLRLLGNFIHAGWCGVTLFFLLSGFLISGILWDGKAAPGWWRRFYWHRTLRIFPLYYAALLIVLLSAVRIGNGRVALSHLWIFALYLQNIPQLSLWTVDTGSPLVLSHFWSLAVEEQFYLLWPFLLMRARTLSQARRLCVAVFLLSVLFRVVLWGTLTPPFDYAESLPARAGELAAGAYLAMCFRDPAIWRRVQAFAPTLLFGALLCFLTLGAMQHSFRLETNGMFLFGLPSITLAFASFLVLALGKGITVKLVSVRWLRWLGGISYGIYVFHVLLTPVFQTIAVAIAPHASRNQGLCLVAVVAGAFTALLAQLSFRFLERPFLKLRDRVRAG
jgi:peptidoglycan/LPS O-acetylase OafA/YrhL